MSDIAGIGAYGRKIDCLRSVLKKTYRSRFKILHRQCRAACFYFFKFLLFIDHCLWKIKPGIDVSRRKKSDHEKNVQATENRKTIFRPAIRKYPGKKSGKYNN